MTKSINQNQHIDQYEQAVAGMLTSAGKRLIKERLAIAKDKAYRKAYEELEINAVELIQNDLIELNKKLAGDVVQARKDNQAQTLKPQLSFEIPSLEEAIDEQMSEVGDMKLISVDESEVDDWV